MRKYKNILVWSLFDFANTSFAIIVVTFLYAVYFKKVVAQGLSIGDFYWSLATSISMIITALISPILGAIADYSAGKKRFLLFFTLLCIFSTASLYFVKEGNILSGIFLFVVANIGFEAGLVFYDAFLPEITEPKNYGRVSGYGFAAGYFGSIASLSLVFPFINNNQIRETFIVSAFFFLIFSLPLFIYLKDSRKNIEHQESYLKIGYKRVWDTISHLKNYKNLALFLLSYFFYIEGVNTVIYFAGNYASSTMGFSEIELIVFFLTVQTTAIIGSIIFGIIADSIGQKKSIIYTLVIWLITVILAFFVESKNHFYIVGLLAGSAMGSCQSISRSMMSLLTPAEKKTEFFGFYSFFGKSSAVLGPLVFGFISYITNSQRLAIFSLALFFIIGMMLLFNVKDPSVSIKSKS
jgi:UMF1 family MFS transporter